MSYCMRVHFTFSNMILNLVALVDKINFGWCIMQKIANNYIMMFDRFLR